MLNIIDILGLNADIISPHVQVQIKYYWSLLV